MTSTSGDDQGDVYGEYSVDEDPSTEDTLGDGTGSADVADELDRGYSPPERYSAGEGFGNTPYEEEIGETLDQRIAQEIPEKDPYVEAEREAADPDFQGVDDGEIGSERAGRLVDPDQGLGADEEKDLIGDDVGIDGAASSAEEAAVHIVPDDFETDTIG